MNLQAVIELGHKSLLRSEKTANGMTHDWEVFVRGKDDSPIERFVDRVVFTLYKDFPNPVRVVKKPPFVIKESGYGCFQFPIEIYYKNPERKADRFDYDLVLKANCNYGHSKFQTLNFEKTSGEWKKRLLDGGAVPVAGSSSKLHREEKARSEKYVPAPVEVKPTAPTNLPTPSPKNKIKPPKEVKEVTKPKLLNSFADIFGEPDIQPEKKKKDRTEPKKNDKPSSQERDKGKSKEPSKDKDKEKVRPDKKHKEESQKKAPDKEITKPIKKEVKSETATTKKDDVRSSSEKPKGESSKSKGKEGERDRSKDSRSDKKDKSKDKKKEKSDKTSKDAKESVSKPSEKEGSKRSEKKKDEIKKEKSDLRKDEPKVKTEIGKVSSKTDLDKKIVKKDGEHKNRDQETSKSDSPRSSTESKLHKSKEKGSHEKIKQEPSLKDVGKPKERPKERKPDPPKESVKAPDMVKPAVRDGVAKKTMPVAKDQAKQSPESVKSENEKSPVKKLEESMNESKLKKRAISSSSLSSSSTSVSSPSHMSSSSDSSRSPSPEPKKDALPAKSTLPLQQMMKKLSESSRSSPSPEPKKDAPTSKPTHPLQKMIQSFSESSNSESELEPSQPEVKKGKRLDDQAPVLTSFKADDDDKMPRGKGPPKLSLQVKQRSRSSSSCQEEEPPKREATPSGKESVKKQAPQNKFPSTFLKRAIQNKERENEILQKEKETAELKASLEENAKMLKKVFRTATVVPTERAVKDDHPRPKVKVESPSTSSSSDSEADISQQASRLAPLREGLNKSRSSSTVPELSSRPRSRSSLKPSSSEETLSKGRQPRSPVVAQKEIKRATSSLPGEQQEVGKKVAQGRNSSPSVDAPKVSRPLPAAAKREPRKSTSASSSDEGTSQASKQKSESSKIFAVSVPARPSPQSKQLMSPSPVPNKRPVSPDSSSDDEPARLSVPKVFPVSPVKPMKKVSPVSAAFSPPKVKVEERLSISSSSEEDFESSSKGVKPSSSSRLQKVKCEGAKKTLVPVEKKRENSGDRSKNNVAIRQKVHSSSSSSDSLSEGEVSDSPEPCPVKPAPMNTASPKKLVPSLSRKSDSSLSESSSDEEAKPNKTLMKPLLKPEAAHTQKLAQPAKANDDISSALGQDRRLQSANFSARLQPFEKPTSLVSNGRTVSAVSEELARRTPRAKAELQRASSSSSSSDSDGEPVRPKSVQQVLSKSTLVRKRNRSSSSEGEQARTRAKKPQTRSPRVVASLPQVEQSMSPVVKTLPSTLSPLPQPVESKQPPFIGLEPEGIKWVSADSNADSVSKFTDEYLADMLELQRRICNLSDPALAQKVVDIIEQTGHYDVSEDTFDFDACKLDVGTIHKLRSVLSL